MPAPLNLLLLACSKGNDLKCNPNCCYGRTTLNTGFKTFSICQSHRYSWSLSCFHYFLSDVHVLLHFLQELQCRTAFLITEKNPAAAMHAECTDSRHFAVHKNASLRQEAWFLFLPCWRLSGYPGKSLCCISHTLFFFFF